MDAKHFLKQVEMLDTRIKNKLIEQQQWRDIALGITANMDGERVSSSGGSKSKMAGAIDKCVDMESEIDGLIDALVDTKRNVIKTIEQLDSPTEYDILHKRYIQFMPLKEIADIYKRNLGGVRKTHSRAIRNLQNILNK